jgi:5-methyltetrahydrofolate--homocysteine methyltransferase
MPEQAQPRRQPDRSKQLAELLSRRILLLDGATGTLMQEKKLVEADFRGARFPDHDNLKGNYDVLSLTGPEIVASVHRAYLEAGADIIETNTFSATSIAQSDYGLQDHVAEMNFAAARIARECADAAAAADGRPRFVAGVLGPTNRTASISPDVSDPGKRNVRFDELVVAYREAALALADGGADIIMVETVFDTLNARAALYALEAMFEEEGFRLPVMVSGTITDASPAHAVRPDVEAFWNSVRHARPFAVGLNCALGAEPKCGRGSRNWRGSPTARSACTPTPACRTNFGEYDDTPEHMAGCSASSRSRACSTSSAAAAARRPEHIAAIAEAVSGKPPRSGPGATAGCRLSGSSR